MTASAADPSTPAGVKTRMDILARQVEPIAPVADGATITLPCARGRRFAVTLGGSGRTVALSGDSDGQKIELVLTQDGTGGRTVTTWPAGVSWAAGSAPTLRTAPGAIDVVELWRLGSGSYRGYHDAASGGGGALPGGSANQVQSNDGGGGFAGAANVEVSGGHLKLVSGGDPSPPTGGLLLYSKSVAGRHLPKIIGPAGIDTVLQVGLHGNAVFMVAPTSGTAAPGAWGGTLTTAATMSAQQTIASANPWLATWRKRFQTSTAAGNQSGMRTAYAQWYRGNAAGFGGFFFRAQLGGQLNLNGGQKFVGLCASTGALAGDPSALVNMCGMGNDAADPNTGNWQFMRNDGSGVATKVDLGTNAARTNTTHGYDLVMYCPPGAATELFVRITNLHTSVVVLDTSYSTDLPAVNVGMAFKAEVRNGAVASADNLEVAKVYVESDY